MLYAVVHQGIDFVGFVEHRIHAQLGAAHPDVGGGIVAQHHHLLVRPAVAAGGQHAQATALAQEQVHDGQVPLLLVAGEPALALVFGLRHPHRLDGCQFFQSTDEVLADGGIVFNDVRAEFHYGSR